MNIIRLPARPRADDGAEYLIEAPYVHIDTPEELQPVPLEHYWLRKEPLDRLASALVIGAAGWVGGIMTAIWGM